MNKWIVLLSVLMGCSGIPLSHNVLVKVTNESFDVRRIRFYCDGHQVGVVREPPLNKSVTRGFRSASCQMAYYRVETINEYWAPDGPILYNPGDTLAVVIRSFLPLTYHTVR